MPTKTHLFWLLGMFICSCHFIAAQSPVAAIGEPQSIVGASVCAGEELIFSSSSLNASDSASFYWIFGGDADPQIAEGVGPHSVVFTAEGEQEVTLIVDNVNGWPADSASVNFLTLAPPTASIELISLGWNFDAYEAEGESFFVHCNSSDSTNFMFELTSQEAMLHTLDWGDGSPVWEADGTAFVAEHVYGVGAYTLTYTVADSASGCSMMESYSVFNGTAPNISFQSSGTYSCLGDVFEVTLGSQGSLTNYELLFSDSSLYTFTTAADTTVQHSFSANSCGFETNSYSNAYMLELVATNGCSFEISTDIEFDPVFVSSAPTADLISTACPGCSGTSFSLTDGSTDAVFASPSGCQDTLLRFWTIVSDLDYSLDTGEMGAPNGYIGADYLFGGWTHGDSVIEITVEEPGVFEAWLYTGNVCGYDSVFYSCEILPAGEVNVLSSLWEDGTLEICDGDSVQGFEVSSSLGDTLYWSIQVPDAIDGISEVSGSGISPISFPGWLLTNSSISTQTVEIEIGLQCDTGSEILLIDVLPTIQVYLGPPAPLDTVCSGETLFMLVNTTVHGVYVEWEVDTLSAVGGGLAGNGPLINDQVFNLTESLQSLDYVFSTPFASCPAEPYTFTLTVVPEFDLPSPLDSIIACPNEVVDVPNYEVPLDGMEYSWTVSGDQVGLDDTGQGYLSEFQTQNESNDDAEATISVQSNLYGCLEETEIEVLIYPEPVLSGYTAAPVFCSGALAELNFLSSVEPVEIQWQVSTNGAVTGPSSGAGNSPVELEETMSNGSTSLDSIQFILSTPNYVCPAEPFELTAYVAPALILPALADIQVCNGDSVTIEDFDLGIDGAEYSWFTENDAGVGIPPSGEEVLTEWIASSESNEEAIQAQVVVVAEVYGCSDSTEFGVIVEPIPEVVVTNWFDEVCSNESLDASVESTVSTGIVTWSTESGADVSGAFAGSGTSVQDVLFNAGNEVDSVLYTFVVSDAFCPSDSLSFSVDVVPSFELTEVGPLAWCAGEEAAISGYETNASGVTYTWSNTDESIGLLSGGEGLVPPWTATNTTDGSITSEVMVFANLSSCPEESISVQVVVHPTPQLTSNVGPNGGLDCQTGTAVIEAFSSTGFGDFEFDGTYVISTNGSVAEVGASGEYVIDFVDQATGCPAQIEVVVSEPIPAVIEGQTLDSLACFGLDNATISVEAGGGADLIYDWFPPVSTTSMAENLGPGTYEVVVTNASNCQDSASFVLEPVLPIEVVVLDSGASICGASNGFIEVVATGGYGELTYDWGMGIGPLLWAIPTGTYPLTVTDEYGCEVTDTFTIDCAEDIPIGINQLLTPNGDGKNDVWILEDLYLYPNHSVKVFNRWGELVYEAAPYLNDWAGTWETGSGDGSVLPSASYYYLFDPGLSTAEPSRGFLEIQNEGR